MEPMSQSLSHPTPQAPQAPQATLQNATEAVIRGVDQRIIAEKKTQATLRRMQENFLASINAHALVLVLLATVTYAGFLQPPGGTSSVNGGGEDMQTHLATQIFIYFNSSSFYLSVADLLLCVGSSLSPLTSISTWEDDIPAAPGGHDSLQTERNTTKQVSKFVASTLYKLILVNVVFSISLVCCVGAFTAAGFVVTKNHGNRVSVIVTSITGVLFFCIFMVWLLRDTGRFLSKVLKHKSLSTPLQKRASTFQVQFRYLAVD